MLVSLDRLYRAEGGRAPLAVTGALTTVDYAGREAARKAAGSGTRPGGARAAAPAPPAGTGSGAPPVTLHATGLCVDIGRPANAWDYKVLEYALSRMGDRMRIAWMRDASVNGYHLSPNPAFAEELLASAGR